MGEPLSRQCGGVLKGAGFFEEVTCSGNHLQCGGAPEAPECFAIEAKDIDVIAPDNEERRCLDSRQRGSGKIGPATATNDAAH
jgi:hypothetical protein